MFHHRPLAMFVLTLFSVALPAQVRRPVYLDRDGKIRFDAPANWGASLDSEKCYAMLCSPGSPRPNHGGCASARGSLPNPNCGVIEINAPACQSLASPAVPAQPFEDWSKSWTRNWPTGSLRPLPAEPKNDSFDRAVTGCRVADIAIGFRLHECVVLIESGGIRVGIVLSAEDDMRKFPAYQKALNDIVRSLRIGKPKVP